MYIADGKECYKQVTNEIAKLGINTPLACYKDINFATNIDQNNADKVSI